MNLKELQAERATLLDGCLSLQAAAKQLGQELSAQALTIIEANTTKIDEIDAQIAAISKSNAALSKLDAQVAAGHKALPTQSNQATVKAAIEVGADLRAQDPAKGFKNPREFMQAVMKAGQGYQADERLQFLATVGSDEQTGANNSLGGFLVPEAFSPNLLQLDPEVDFISGRTMNIPMAAPTVKLSARVDKNHSTSVSGGLVVGRSAETVAKTASNMSFQEITLHANSLFGLAYATEEILTDSPISFAAILATGFGQEFGATAINERLNGTGLGQYMGILNAPATISVAKETGQTAATVNYQNIVKMRARMWGYGNAIWMANQDVLPQLMQMNQTVGVAGVPAWQPSAREDVPDLLFGRPLFLTEFCQSVGTVGDIVCANWSQYLEGTYQPIESAESIHVRFVNHERAFKFWTRNDGRPWWNTALTPKHGSTLSPFVTLATRA